MLPEILRFTKVKAITTAKELIRSLQQLWHWAAPFHRKNQKTNTANHWMKFMFNPINRVIMKNEKILKKIKALLAKTVDNGATEQEALMALNKANELMTEHYITEFDLKDIEEAKLITIEVPLYKT